MKEQGIFSRNTFWIILLGMKYYAPKKEDLKRNFSIFWSIFVDKDLFSPKMEQFLIKVKNRDKYLEIKAKKTLYTPNYYILQIIWRTPTKKLTIKSIMKLTTNPILHCSRYNQSAGTSFNRINTGIWILRIGGSGNDDDTCSCSEYTSSFIIGVVGSFC